ncbi:MAG: glucose 1-dehydrogenase [Gammaproteobacteria bacterium]|nr:glucose 1-dehydrogenase [Gammaproteobacteria bacterium]
MTNKKLANKVAIVTGAASGIGRAIASLYLDNGASVLVVDMPGQNLQEQFNSDAVQYLEVDITESHAPQRIVNECINAFAQLDILVNNAGICIAGDFEELSDEQWERILSVNVTSMFRISREAIPHLKESKKGRIINLGSIMSDMGGPSLSIYGMSKHAVAGLSKGMAVDLGKHQITVNYLQPGSIVTALSEPFMDDPAFKKYWEDKAPIGRLGQPEEVAYAALFLAADEAQFISGLGLNVDGGAIVNF